MPAPDALRHITLYKFITWRREVGDSRVRLYGIDAPESKQLCLDRGGREFACGASATLAFRAPDPALFLCTYMHAVHAGDRQKRYATCADASVWIVVTNDHAQTQEGPP